MKISICYRNAVVARIHAESIARTWAVSGLRDPKLLTDLARQAIVDLSVTRNRSLRAVGRILIYRVSSVDSLHDPTGTHAAAGDRSARVSSNSWRSNVDIERHKFDQ